MSESAVLGITERDTVWQGFSPAFDMWIEETWISFFRGAHVIVGTREECRDTSNLSVLWKHRNISVIHAVPTLMSMVAMEDSENAGVPDNVRLVVSFVFWTTWTASDLQN
jgi:non-ribosomal peptide synthetase component F